MAERADSGRFAFVDALRGIAALAVVLFHMYSKNLVPMTGFTLPEPFHSLLHHGNLGVYVFFVISGFVIAHSIRSAVITPRYVGRFALRRSIRLDPPYWATIAAMIVLTAISNHAQHARSLPMPTAGAVVAHVFYAQGFLGYPHIVGVFWTLCFEIQFYLVLVLGMGVVQAIERRAPVSARWYVFLPLWGLGLACVAGYVNVHPALFVYAWPSFFLGVVVNWAYHRRAEGWVVPAIMLSSLVLLPVAPLEISVACATALTIHLVARAGRLETLTMGRALQYLGRISYSLYLVHMLVGTPLFRLGIRALGGRPDTLHAVGLMVLATAVSIIAAHFMYALIERPAMRLAQRLGRRPVGVGAAPPVGRLS
jgi:peptidoglycan/LPS O-acetylase OafA/YrhL